MFFSPSPVSKRIPSSNDLNRYLPEIDLIQSSQNEALYSKFSTVEQIAMSIEFEREIFDREQYVTILLSRHSATESVK